MSWLFSSPRNPDITIKIATLGDPGAGRQHLAMRFTAGVFRPFPPYIGSDYRVKRVTQRGKDVMIELVHCFSLRFGVPPDVLWNTHVVLFVIDLSSSHPLDSLQRCIDAVGDGAQEETIMAVAGTKRDALTEENMENVLRLESVCNEKGILFFSTSAKTGDNVDEMFGSLIDAVIDKIDSQIWLGDGSWINPPPRPPSLIWSVCHLL